MKNNTNKIHHAHLGEDEDEEEIPRKRLTRGKDVYEYVLFSTLYGSITPGEDTWLIDSGASKHMSGQKKILSKIEERNAPWKVSLGDYYQYPIKELVKQATSLIQEIP